MEKETPIINRIALFNIFKGFVDNYDNNNAQIANKLFHTLRVADNCDLISDSLGLKGLDKDVAWAIGMLHDVARFGQAIRSGTYIDNVIDHAKDGAKLLFDLGLIVDYIPRYKELSEEYLECIKKAIYYHNAFELPDDLSDKEALFCKLIRDADKIDIIRMCYSDNFYVAFNVTREEIEKSTMSPHILDYVYNRSNVKLVECRTPADRFLAKIALVFGLYFEQSRLIMHGNGYIYRYFGLIEFEDVHQQEILMDVKDYVYKYLDE